MTLIAILICIIVLFVAPDLALMGVLAWAFLTVTGII